MIEHHADVDLLGFDGKLKLYLHYGCSIIDDSAIYLDKGTPYWLQADKANTPGMLIFFSENGKPFEYPLIGSELQDPARDGECTLKTFCFDDMFDWHSQTTVHCAVPKDAEEVCFRYSLGEDYLLITIMYTLDGRIQSNAVAGVSWKNGVLELRAKEDCSEPMERIHVFRGFEIPD